jgi:polyhydroxyalkanoate synthesis repressor PhaR
MSDIVIIKKYANRRLYNTETSTYITLDDLAEMVRKGRDFEVVDAKTGNDLTRPVLAQIIFEEETKGAAMLPLSFMKQLIGFYDHSMQSVLPHYLEMVMENFMQNQHEIKEKTDSVLGGFSPFQAMQSFQRQNMEQMQKMMGMFNPFLAPTNNTDDSKDQKIADLSAQVANLSQQIEALKKK